MKNWIKKRADEPTTYLGLSALVAGLGMLFKINEAPMIAETLSQSAQTLAQGDFVTPAALLIGGILGMIKAEKGK